MLPFRREREQAVTNFDQLATYVSIYNGRIDGTLVHPQEEKERIPGSFTELPVLDFDTGKFPIEFIPESENESSPPLTINEGSFSAYAIWVASPHRIRAREKTARGRQYENQGKIAVKIVERAVCNIDKGKFSFLVRDGKIANQVAFYEPDVYSMAGALLDGMGHDVRIHRIIESSAKSPALVGDVISIFQHSLQRNVHSPVTDPAKFDKRQAPHGNNYVVIQLYPRPERDNKPKVSLDTLPEALGFIPTDKLRKLRADYGNMDFYSNEAEQIWAAWEAEAKSLLDSVKSSSPEDSRLGMHVEECLMLRDGERDGDFEEKLRFALDFAGDISNMRAVAVLEAAIPKQEDLQM